MENKKENYEHIDLIEILCFLISKSKKIIFAILIVCSAIMIALYLVYHPVYMSGAKISVNNVELNNETANFYKNTHIYTLIDNKYDFLIKNLTVHIDSINNIVDVCYEGNNSIDVANIVNLDVEEGNKQLLQKYENAEIEMIYYAEPSNSYTTFSFVKSVLMSLIGAFTIVCGFAILKFIIRKRDNGKI